MVADADEVETRLIGHTGVPEHLAHLVDAGLQLEVKEDFVVGGQDTNSVRDGQRGTISTASAMSGLSALLLVHCASVASGPAGPAMPARQEQATQDYWSQHVVAARPRPLKQSAIASG